MSRDEKNCNILAEWVFLEILKSWLLDKGLYRKNMFMLDGGRVPNFPLFSFMSNRMIIHGSKNSSSLFCWKSVTLKYKTTG